MARFKTRRRKNYFNRFILFIILIVLSFIICFKILIKNDDISKIDIALLNTGLNNSPNMDIDLTSPKAILYKSLNYIMDIKEDNKIKPVKEEVTKPIVYIYNTHQSESYDTNLLQAYNISYTVESASYILKDYLKEYGVESIIEENSITDYLKNNGLRYKDSYKASRFYINDKLNQYPSIKYLIDLHRDSSKRSITTYESYAKVAFVVGLDHPNYEPNLNLAERINNKLDPNITRGIIKKSGRKSNGIYNQDLSPNSMLIEVGGPENNIEEVSNTLKVLAKAIYEEININEN